MPLAPLFGPMPFLRRLPGFGNSNPVFSDVLRIGVEIGRVMTLVLARFHGDQILRGVVETVVVVVVDVPAF